IKAAVSHQGFAFINVISPCVTFNNNPGSTKSYDYVREHIEATGKTDLIPEKSEILASYESGTGTEVMLHDGTFIKLEKLAANRDPFNRMEAMNALQNARNRNEILTGLLYIENESGDLHQTINSTDRPLNSLEESDLCPGAAVLAEINEDLR
ncbi:MAG: hypothetical protein ACOYKR_13005, partial [Sphingobacterium thalpophilum]